MYYDQSDHCNYCEVNVSVAKYEETIILKYYSINIRILVLKIIQNIWSILESTFYVYVIIIRINNVVKCKLWFNLEF